MQLHYNSKDYDNKNAYVIFFQHCNSKHSIKELLILLKFQSIYCNFYTHTANKNEKFLEGSQNSQSINQSHTKRQ